MKKEWQLKKTMAVESLERSSFAQEKPGRFLNQENVGIATEVVGAFVTAWEVLRLNVLGVGLGVGLIAGGEWLRRRGKKQREGK